jgi:hypothetical protein
MWRHDTALTAYQPLPAAMTGEPRVLASHVVGTGPGVPTFADLLGTGKDAEVLVVARARLSAYDSSGKRLWEFVPQGYVLGQVEWVDDLDGDGRNEVVALAGRMGGTRQAYLILEGTTGRLRASIAINTGDFGWRGLCGAYRPDLKGKQVFLVTSMRQEARDPPAALTPPGRAHQAIAASNGQFALWSYDGKAVEQRWAWTPQEHGVEYAEVLVADLEGNGRLRGIVSSWCHVWNLDLATGALVTHTAWDPQGANPRHYGLNRLVDVDGDGRLDFVNVALTKHIDVLRNVEGKLRHAWTHAWPDTVTTEARSLRWPTDPVVDLDGDGKLEIVASLFDGLADQRWHVGLWDAATGAPKGDALDLVPMATVFLWGKDRGRALLCYRSRSLNFDPPERLEVWRSQQGRLENLWSAPSASRLFLGTSATTSDVDGDGRAEFFTTGKGASSTPQAWGLDALGSIIAKPGSPQSPTSRPIPARIPPLQGTVVPYLLAADLEGDRRNELLLYDNSTITILRLESGQLRVLETTSSTEIPIVGDLLGDGMPCLLTGGRGEDGNLWVQARKPDRSTLWRFTFPASAACGQYTQRSHYFTLGRFTGGKQLDVFTYSSKPAARTYVLDGRSGQPVWERRDLPAIERHFQAFSGRASVWDYNRDGAEDVIFCNPDYYCIADGKTGKLLVGPVEIAQLAKWWAAYASPALLRRDHEPPLVYLGGAYSARACLSLDGRRGLWREFLPAGRWPLHVGSERFVEGLLPPSQVRAEKAIRRGWRALQAEADGTLVCFDATTGRTFWTMPLPTAPSGIISGDVDGDGSPEALLGGQDGHLRVIRDGGEQGQLLWRKPFDAPVGTPLLADLDGDGTSEAVVSVGDGRVYVLGR